jgi:hypothetical protein
LFSLLLALKRIIPEHVVLTMMRRRERPSRQGQQILRGQTYESGFWNFETKTHTHSPVCEEMKPPARPAPGSLAKKKTVTMAADSKKATSSAAAKLTSPLSPAAKTGSRAAFTSPSTPSTPAASKSATAQGFGKGQEVALLQHDPQQNAMTVLDHTQIKDYSQLQIAAWRPDVQVDSEIAAKSIFSGASIETYMERQLRYLLFVCCILGVVPFH